MKELEKHIEARFIRGLKSRGLVHLKLNVMFSRGWPDRQVFIPGGRPFLCELKRPGENLTPLQEEVHAQLKALGYDVETHWSAETALIAVDIRLRKAWDSIVEEVNTAFKTAMGPAQLPKEGRQVAPRARPRRRPVP